MSYRTGRVFHEKVYQWRIGLSREPRGAEGTLFSSGFGGTAGAGSEI
jgi:hypothetical protein